MEKSNYLHGLSEYFYNCRVSDFDEEHFIRYAGAYWIILAVLCSPPDTECVNR